MQEQLASPTARLAALGARDVAEIVDDGPGPVRRAVYGVLVGFAAGALAALLTPRPDRAHRGAVRSQP